MTQIPHFNKMIAVEFSLSQRCFHKHTVKSMLETNTMNMVLRKQTDYVPIGLFQTHEIADQFIDNMKVSIKNPIKCNR